MSLRKVEIEFNKFPESPKLKLKDVDTGDYIKSIEVNLFQLTAQYKIEEFGDHNEPNCYSEYAALKYLLPTTNLFKFKSGHPGVARDSRRENSRVIGQTFCRYFNYYFLDAEYTAHISSFLGKKLGSEFGNVAVERNGDGDTPDFISADSTNGLFLSEAKGRRKVVSFSDDEFDKWRKQFDRIKILQDGTELSLKGYILEFAIANENNKLANSKLLVEDPWTGGQRADVNPNFVNLVKCGHYKEILEKIRLGYIGGALVYQDKLSAAKYSLPVFFNKVTAKQYIGLFSAFRSKDYVDPFFLFTREVMYYLKNRSEYFYGIEKSLFARLVAIGRGNFNMLSEINSNSEDQFFNESAIEFKDGSLLCDPGLMRLDGFEEF